MGLCGSGLTAEQRDELARNRAIEKQNEDDHLTEQERIKLLLLGAGESGKSTIFKQMKLIYGEQYTDEDLKAITPVVYNNTITSMKVLIEQCQNLKLWDACAVQKECNEFMEVDDDSIIDEKVGALIAAIWGDQEGEFLGTDVLVWSLVTEPVGVAYCRFSTFGLLPSAMLSSAVLSSATLSSAMLSSAMLSSAPAHSSSDLKESGQRTSGRASTSSTTRQSTISKR